MTKKNLMKRLAVLACVVTMSLTSMSLTTEALGDQTITTAVSTALSRASSSGSSFTSKQVTMKSEYTCTTDAVRINWNKVSGATGYRIYRYNATTKKWVKLTTIKNGNTTTYRNSGLPAGSKYRYKVKAYKKVNGVNYWGKASAEKIVTTKPKQVTMKASTATKNAIRLNWTKVKCDGYKVYQKVGNCYELIATVRDSDTTTYRVSGLTSGTKYTFKVRAYRKDTTGGVNYGKCAVKIKSTVMYKSPTITSVTESSSKLKIKWSEVTGMGYELYFTFDGADSNTWGNTGSAYVKVATIKDSNTTSYTLDMTKAFSVTSNGNTWDIYPWSYSGFQFKIRAYDKDSSGNKIVSKCDVSEMYYPIYLIREKRSDGIAILESATKSSSNKNKVSSSDQKILKKFADEHFKSSWSDADKIAYTLTWIYWNVTYAVDGNWSKVSGISYTEAVFNKQLGQCAQYNGALVAMMNYLGYDASLVYGVNKYGANHFWAEIKIDGKLYILDTGNKGLTSDQIGSDGSAHFMPSCMCTLYKTSGYEKS